MEISKISVKNYNSLGITNIKNINIIHNNITSVGINTTSPNINIIKDSNDNPIFTGIPVTDTTNITQRLENIENNIDTPISNEYTKDYIYINDNIKYLNVYTDETKTNLVYYIEYIYDSDNLIKKILNKNDGVIEYNYKYSNDVLIEITKNIIG